MRNSELKSATQFDTVTTDTVQSFANQAAAFIPAKLIRYKKRWTIEYYIFDTDNKRMIRKQIRVERIRKRYGARANIVITNIIQKINKDLLCGNIPFTEYISVKNNTINDCVLKYLEIKRPEIRAATFENYRFFLSKLQHYLSINGHRELYINNFTSRYAFDFFEYLSNSKVSNAYYNQTIIVVKGFWNWCVERGFTNQNPFEKIKPRKSDEKFRRKIPPKDLEIIFTYLKEKNCRFYIFCLLVYSCLLRPQELLRCKISNFDLDGGLIFMNGNQTKNKKTRKIIIPNFALVELNSFWIVESIEDKKKDMYLFGGRELSAGYKLKTSKVTCDTWRRMRNAINIPSEYQLYSLRDTGITDMLYSNITPKTVQMHADHHNLSITEIYSHTLTTQGEQELRDFTPPKP